MHDIVDFLQPLPARWHTTTYGDGQVINQSDELHLTLPASDAVQYHDTQLSDYASKADFRWRPPLRMEVVARCSVPTLSPNPSPSGRGEQDHLSRDTTSH